MARIKGWLGYYAELWHALAALAGGRAGSRLTVLDVATGGADVPADLATRGARAGLAWRVVGLDRHPQVIQQARRSTAGLASAALVRADALCLPLAAGSVDVVHCAFALHHFPWEQARTLLAELGRVARRGVIVSDLVRSRLAYWGAWTLFHLWRPRHRLSRRDGPLSVLRAYSAPEVRCLAAQAGLVEPVLVRHFPYRYTLYAPGRAFDRRASAP